MTISDVIPDVVTRWGRSVTFTWPNASTATCSAVVQGAVANLVDGLAVLAGDRFVTVANSAVGAEPEIGGTVTIGSDVYSIIAVQQREASGTILGYRVQIRGGI